MLQLKHHPIHLSLPLCRLSRVFLEKALAVICVKNVHLFSCIQMSPFLNAFVTKNNTLERHLRLKATERLFNFWCQPNLGTS